jgi:hypothetical protein
VLRWAKDAEFSYTTISARAEEVATKPAYRDALKKRRCLMPAEVFYAWVKIPGFLALQSARSEQQLSYLLNLSTLDISGNMVSPNEREDCG